MQHTNMVKNLIARILATALLCAGASPALSQLVRPQNGGTGISNNVAATLTRTGSHALTITTSATAALTISNTANQVYFNTAASTIGTSANFLFDNSAVRLTVGTGSGTSSGVHAGYSGSSGAGALWSTAVTPDATNYSLQVSAGTTYVNAPTDVRILANNTLKFQQVSTAGAGPSITAGTAASAVSLLSGTQTRNFTTSATDYVSLAFTTTATHASDNYLNITDDAVSMFKVGLNGAGAFASSVNPGTVGVISTGNLFVDSSGGDVAFSSNSGGKHGWAFRSGTLGLNASSDAVLGWTGTAADTALSGPDAAVSVALSYVAAGVLGVGTGAAGSVAGTLSATSTLSNTKDRATAGALTIGGIATSLVIGAATVTPASSGKRFLCISTAGVVTSETAACSGT